MIPLSVISILLKNDLIDVKELGRLACVNSIMHENATDGALWSSLLRSRWPSTTLLFETFSKKLKGSTRISHRIWFKRLSTSSCPGVFTGKRQFLQKAELEELIRRRACIIKKQSSLTEEIEGDNNDAPPLAARPALSLEEENVALLVDIYSGGKACTSGTMSLPLSHNLNDIGCLDMKINLKAEPNAIIELGLGSRGQFASRTFALIHAVRLSDCKIICIHKTKATLTKSWPSPSNTFTGNVIGRISTPLTCRMNRGSEICTGFCFGISDLKLSLPRAPHHYGYDYTLKKFRAYAREYKINAGDHDEFMAFRNTMWENAASKPDLAIFFKQAKDSWGSDRNYFGQVTKDPRAKIVGFARFDNRENYRRRVNLSSCKHEGIVKNAADITVSQVFQHLFDSDEPSLS